MIEFRKMEHETSGTISDETPIWRYMDLPKFGWMLATRCLWFTKIAKLDDPYEGFCTAIRRDVPPDDQSPKSITHSSRGVKTQVTLQQMAASISHLSADKYENAPHCLYANSWCLAVESIGMWEIYGLHGCGVAIKSSIGQYKQAANFGIPNSQYDFRPVEYDLISHLGTHLDLSQATIPVLGPGLWKKILEVAFNKRACYHYEQEWRAALYQDARPEVFGIGVEFDLDKLVTAVYAGPRSEPFLHDVLLAIMNQFGLRKPLERSDLLLRPPQKETSASAV